MFGVTFALRRIGRFAGVAAVVAAFCALSPSAAAQENPYAPAPAAAAPGAPVVAQSVALEFNSDGKTYFVAEWRPPANRRIPVSGYKIQREIRVVDESARTPAICDASGTDRWSSDGFAATVASNIFQASHDFSTATTGRCFRWKIAACNSAGCGDETVAGPVLNYDPECSASETESLLGCVKHANVQGADWCWHVQQQLGSSATVGLSPDPSRENDLYDLSCGFTDDNFDCDGKSAPIQDGSGNRRLCPIVGAATNYCETLSEYSAVHRSCVCSGHASAASRARSSDYSRLPPALSCECNVAGANPACECPAGTVYHPDLNACAPPAAQARFAAVGTPSVAEKVMLEFSLQGADVPAAGEVNIYLGDSAVALPECAALSLSEDAAVSANNLRASCQTYLPGGEAALRAEYELQCPPAGCAARQSGRAHLQVTVASDIRSECETKNPAVNPLGGAFQSGNLCVIHGTQSAAFHANSGNMWCALYRSDIDCLEYWKIFRDNNCVARGFLHKHSLGRSSISAVIGNGDLTCVCPDGGPGEGKPPVNGECPSDHDDALIEAVHESPPNLATIRMLLSDGARRNVTTSAGVPLLFVAATLLHAEVVSVLITAGADVNLTFGISTGHQFQNISVGTPRLLPVLLAELAASNHPLSANRRFVETFVHFGDAAGDRFDWRQETGNGAVGDKVLSYLDARHADNAASDGQNPFLTRAGWYVQERGGVCAHSPAAPSPVCASPPTCPATSAGIYSCSQCAGYSLYSEGAGACVAQCRGSEQADTTTWPDHQCECVDGNAPDAFGCPSTYDGMLLDEMEKTRPDAAQVGNLLSLGARPDITTSAGVPVLIVAASLRLAEVVSVLITGGADPGRVHAGRIAPWHAAAGGGTLTARQDAAALIHFGDAVNIAAASGGAAFSWRSGGAQTVIAALAARYQASSDEAEKRVLEVMGGYLTDQGAECSKYAPLSAEALCGSRRSCAADGVAKSHACGRCGNGNNVLAADGGTCAAACGANEDLDATAWPEPACGCADGGAPNARGQCLGDFDDDLLDAVQQAEPVVASVVALLNDGANPNLISDDGIHILVAAATLLHADVISVLVTAGATPRALSPDSQLMPNLIYSQFDGSDATLAVRAAEAIKHFGDAAARAMLTSSALASSFDWDSRSDAFLDIYDSLASDYNSATDEEARAAIRFIAEYMRDQGARCGLKIGFDHFLCVPSRTCPTTGGGGVSSCSVCAGNPLRAREAMDGDACVSACRGGEEVNRDAWPDLQCQCRGGTTPDAFGCFSTLTPTLIAEVRVEGRSPNLATIRALLDMGAQPGITVAGGWPLAMVAATLKYAEVVSVLITGGADPAATHNPFGTLWTIPDAVVNSGGDESGKANVLIHFGEAAAIAALTSDAVFNWRDAANPFFTALAERHMDASSTEAARDELETMGAYALHRGALCPSAYAGEPFCTSRRACESSGALTYSCAACAGAPFRGATGGTCFSACGTGQIGRAANSWGEKRCECPGGAACADAWRIVVGADETRGEGVLLVNGAPTQSNTALPLRASVRITAKAKPGYYLSRWDGLCATVAFGTGAAENVCSFSVEAASLTVDARVSLTFSPLILPYGVPLTGPIPDRFFVSIGAKSEFAHYCEIFGITVEENPHIARGQRTERCVFNLANPLTGEDRMRCQPSDVGAPRQARSCGSVSSERREFDGYFVRTRACNLRNRLGNGSSASNCGRQCEEGEIARGLRCIDKAAFQDECASVSCSADAFCTDPDPYSIQISSGIASADAFCTCREGFKGDGVSCGDPSVAGELLTELRKPRGSAAAARVRQLLGRLSDVNLHPDPLGVPLLIVAATVGHAEIVSILATAGADASATDPTAGGWNVVHHMAGTVAAGGIAMFRLSVLRSFGGALEALGESASFDWNATDDDGRRALDILSESAANFAGGNPRHMEQMADYLRARGASCQDELDFSYVCLGAAVGTLQTVSYGSYGGGTLRASISSGVVRLPGTAVTFTAEPLETWFIEAWEGDGAHCFAVNTECVATVPEGRALLVTVRFASQAAQSSVAVASIPADGRGGTLMFAGASVVAGGATVTFTAEPAAGWYVFAWQGDGAGCLAEEAECARTADKDLFVTVRFEEAARVEYGEIPPDQSGGTVTAPIASGGVTIRGSMLTFLATPATGWYVAGWSRGDCVNAGAAASPGVEKECVVTAEADTLVTVTFAEAPTAGTTLRAEILKPKDSDWELARAMLEAGADPDLEVDGNPALVVAAARGHAEIVSVLVTFGANVTARLAGRGSVGRQVPHIVAVNNVETNRASSLYYSWGTALNVLRHFADAVNQVRAPYPWRAATASDFLVVGADGSTPVERQYTAMELLEFRYRGDHAWPGESAAERKRAMVRMTDILRGQGGRCEQSELAFRLICRGSKGTLLEEIQETRISPNVATVSLYLSQGADPDFVDTTGVPVLITSAVLGLAEIVSVLITAGAEMGATDPTSKGWDVVQHMASPLSAPAAGPRAKRARILYDFGGLLDARKAVFNWNRADSDGKRALDLLADAEDAAPGLAGENVTVIYEMADYLLARGAACATTDRARRVCKGGAAAAEARASLVAEVEKAGGVADVSVVLNLLEQSGVTPNLLDAADRPLLIVAASLGHAEIISVLVTAGADVNATDAAFRGRDVVQRAASPLGDLAGDSRALRATALYSFGGALDVRNAASADATFDWNRADADGKRALDLLADAEDQRPRPAGENVTVLYAMADYLRVRGGTCGEATADHARRICAGPRDCPAANRAISGDEDPRACGDCMAGYGVFGETGDLCAAKETGDFGGIAQDVVCRELLGDLEPEGEGVKTVCSGVDDNDTFCILNSAEGLPCRGLLRHVLRCNVGFDRPALNPFFCGAKCDESSAEPVAIGRKCRARP